MSTMHNNSRLIDLSGNSELRDLLAMPFIKFPYLITLNLSNCEIMIISQNIFMNLENLRILDLSFNQIARLEQAAFLGLRRLRHLNLLGNTHISVFEPFAFRGLINVRNLVISGSTIRKLSSYTFAGLQLDTLSFYNNSIDEIQNKVFAYLRVKRINLEFNSILKFDEGLFSDVTGLSTLRTPAYKFCCVRPSYLPEAKCSPEKDEFSSCDDLMRISALQIMVWIMGLCALFGNILAIIYRLVYDRERLKLGFGIFVTNLAAADFLMGVYMLIIAIADAVYRKRFVYLCTCIVNFET